MFNFNLESIIEAVGLTKNKLAVLADVRPNTVNDLANGKAKRIELETIEKLLNAVNEIAATRGINKIYNLNDVVEYVPDNHMAATNSFNLNPRTYELIKEQLKQHRVVTTLIESKEANMIDALLLYEKYIKDKIYPPNVIKEKVVSDYDKLVNQLFYDHLNFLRTLGLIKSPSDRDYTYFALSEKGQAFMDRLESEF